MLRLYRLWHLAGALLCGTGVAADGPAAAAIQGDHAGSAAQAVLAGSASCRKCHPAFHQRWATSRHGNTVVPLSLSWANTNLSTLPAVIRQGQEEYRLDSSDSALVLTVSDTGGKQRRVRAEFALGGRDVWYLVGPLDEDRLQILPLAFDRHRKQWFNPARSAVRPHAASVSGPVEWTSQAYTFNMSCYSCHVSGTGSGRSNSQPPDTDASPALTAKRNHASPSSSESPTGSRWWDEPGIRCESCHGAGAEHVRVCRQAAGSPPPSDLHIVSLRFATQAQLDGLCGSCHARRSALTDSFRPGDLFLDRFDPLLLESDDFYVDGRARGETYTMTSWLSNPCARSGSLDCLYCHTSSGANRFPGKQANQACLPCHQVKVETVAHHSHHAPGQPGAFCVDCHMPEAEFARMRRHDHSLLPPAPSLTVLHGSPNACNHCHSDRDAAWADAAVRRWADRDFQAPVLRRARWIDRARSADWTQLGAMLESLRQENDDPVYVASLIRLLAACPDPHKIPALTEELKDSSPLVRAAAALGLEGVWTAVALPSLVAATGDPVRLVRVRAAQALATLPEHVLQPELQSQVDRAYREFEDMLEIQPDRVSALTALGQFQLDQGRLPEALATFQRGLAVAPDDLGLLLSAGSTAHRAGENDVAARQFEHALDTHPEDPAAWFNSAAFLDLRGQPSEVRRVRREARKALAPPQRREFDERWSRWEARPHSERTN